MNDNFYKSLFVVFGAGAMTLGVGCFGSDSNDDDGSGGTSGSAGSGAGTAGTGGGTPGGIAIVPDATGWVNEDTNSAMVQGAWYPYGDAYGEAKCLTVGMHTADECSTITAPDPLVASFPNEGGKMCTAGTVARVINGPEPSGMMPDYSNIWGAGIGLDLKSTGGDNPMKTPFNFTAAGITGISFEIDVVPLPGLRVEFPMPATEGHADGSNYWGASMTFPPSPVVAGVNVVKWNEVMGPRGAIAFDPTQVLSIQFHVPASAAASGTFEYCISNLTLLTN